MTQAISVMTPLDLMSLLNDCDSDLSAYGHGRSLTRPAALALSTRCRRAIAAMSAPAPSHPFRLAQARQDLYQILVGGSPHGRVSDVLDELIAAVLERAHFADVLAEPQHGNCGVIQQKAARMKPVEAAREDVLNNAQGLLSSNPSTQRAAWEQMVVALDALIAEATREDQS